MFQRALAFSCCALVVVATSFQALLTALPVAVVDKARCCTVPGLAFGVVENCCCE